MKTIIQCSLLAFTLVAIFYQNTEAQQIISTTGSSLQNSAGTLTFTVGELCIQTHTNGNGTLTQGFHQTKITVTAIQDISTSGIAIVLYPNPTSDFVILKFEKGDMRQVSFQLFDSQGKLISNEKLTKPETEIPFMQRSSGNYLLMIIKDGKYLQTFKIIKN